MEYKFKVGEKVTRNEDGKIGTVIGIKEDKAGVNYLVEGIRDGFGLHNGAGFELIFGTYGASMNCRWYRECDLVSARINSKIVITSDGTTTLARLYDGNKVVKSAEAKCSPDDTYDFATGANLAYDRLMRPAAKPEPVQDKPKYKAGDKAKIIQNTSHHGFNNGEIVKIHSNPRKLSDGWCWVCTQEDGKERFNPNVYECDIEPYTEPAKEPAEPVKLYCVKDYEPGRCLTKGKVYEIAADKRFTYDNGVRTADCSAGKFESAQHLMKTWLGKHLVPLVKRPAKVGEYVLMLRNDCVEKNKKGDIAKCIGDGWLLDPTGEYKGGIYATWRADSLYYLVLDGHTPEEPAKEEPKYYSGKVVCVNNSGNVRQYTVGKIYVFKDGEMTNRDDGRTLQKRFSSFKDFNDFSSSEFVELIGEQA